MLPSGWGVFGSRGLGVHRRYYLVLEPLLGHSPRVPGSEIPPEMRLREDKPRSVGVLEKPSGKKPLAQSFKP